MLPLFRVTRVPSRASSIGPAADTVTNFAMLVDAEIEQVRKAGTAKDLDGDGVLDWSELRQAVLKLGAQVVVRARHRPPAPLTRHASPSNVLSSRLELLVRRRPSPTRLRDL